MSETVRENHGISCPKCGRDEQIDACASVWVRLYGNGTDVFESENGDQEWDDDSPCTCFDCGHTGTVGSFGPNENFEQFVRDYVECALRTSTDDSCPEVGDDPISDNFNLEDIAPEAMQRIRIDCAEFYSAHYCFIRLQAGQAGHDFWLTRNGHGAGFWDGDWAEPFASVLTDASKAAGECSLYVGDDNLIYTDG